MTCYSFALFPPIYPIFEIDNLSVFSYLENIKSTVALSSGDNFLYIFSILFVCLSSTPNNSYMEIFKYSQMCISNSAGGVVPLVFQLPITDVRIFKYAAKSACFMAFSSSSLKSLSLIVIVSFLNKYTNVNKIVDIHTNVNYYNDVVFFYLLFRPVYKFIL